MIRKYEDQDRQECETCTHENSIVPIFTCNGMTMCGDCCDHSRKNMIDEIDGQQVCMVCLAVFPCIPRIYTPPPFYKKSVKKKMKIPKIRVYDMDGVRRRVKYWKPGY